MAGAQMERLKPFFPKSHGKSRVSRIMVGLPGNILLCAHSRRKRLALAVTLKESGPYRTITVIFVPVIGAT